MSEVGRITSPPNEDIFWAVYYGNRVDILAVFRSPTTATAFAALVGASTDLVRVRGMEKLVEARP